MTNEGKASALEVEYNRNGLVADTHSVDAHVNDLQLSAIHMVSVCTCPAFSRHFIQEDGSLSASLLINSAVSLFSIFSFPPCSVIVIELKVGIQILSFIFRFQKFIFLLTIFIQQIFSVLSHFRNRKDRKENPYWHGFSHGGIETFNRQPFTLPAVTPSTIYLDRNR